ncbi:hypothetical protein E4T42_05565 [Aureobasidium subglaciale]|nr:hypothetical protein E4T42_05565 [Aureobasidium subglaciale]
MVGCGNSARSFFAELRRPRRGTCTCMMKKTCNGPGPFYTLKHTTIGRSAIHRGIMYFVDTTGDCSSLIFGSGSPGPVLLPSGL